MCNKRSFVLNMTRSPTLFSLKTQKLLIWSKVANCPTYTLLTQNPHTHKHTHMLTHQICTDLLFNVIEQLVAMMWCQEKRKSSGKQVLCEDSEHSEPVSSSYQWKQCGFKTSGWKDRAVVHAQTVYFQTFKFVFHTCDIAALPTLLSPGERGARIH